MAKIWVEAYGCSASFADSEMISGLIVNGGHTLAQNSEESDLNLIVTCSVKDATANKMRYRIKSLKSKPLVVAGCLPKAEQAAVEKFSSNASLLGPNSLGKSLVVINSTLQGKKTIELQDSDVSKTGLPKVRLNPVIGIVEIASGCLSECTFCQTKIAKGDLQSYRIGDIVRQVGLELEDGCKEIWLSSTDNGCYGLDIGDDLPALVNAVAQIPKPFKLRVGMMNPMYMPRIREGLINSFENDKVYKFLHIPVQSGSDKVLNDMKRGHTVETYRDITQKLKEKFGRFTIATDIIVGFPTETEDEFLKTKELLIESKPDIVNLSKYSPRPGTPASEMKQVETDIVRQRSKIIFNLINQISFENNQKWIDWSGNVLFNERNEHGIQGRNFAYKPIFVREKVAIGEEREVKIIGATNHSLIGKLLS